MATSWSFYSAGQLLFGAGCVRQTGGLLSRRGLKTALIVTDPVIADAGIVAPVLKSLQQAGIGFEVFDGGSAEPPVETAIAAATQAYAFKPSAIIGVGGGSNMDLAKQVAVLHAHGGQPADYFGYDNVPGPVTPLVCIPTTAGTGSEVSHAAVLTDTANKMKVSTLSQYLRPQLAVVDPVLTYTCPAQVAADSGIDALTHAVEGYLASTNEELNQRTDGPFAYEGSFPLADCLAEKAISLVHQHLRSAINHPENRAARDGMALAATTAGLAFSNAGVALVHSLEYPLGGALHCSHGAGNGLLLPYVMRFNLPVRTARIARIATLMGVDTTGMSEIDAAEAGIAEIEQLRADIGIPLRIRDIGGKQEQLPGFAAKTFAIKRLLATNPRQATEADLLEILQQAF